MEMGSPCLGYKVGKELREFWNDIVEEGFEPGDFLQERHEYRLEFRRLVRRAKVMGDKILGKVGMDYAFELDGSYNPRSLGNMRNPLQVIEEVYSSLSHPRD